MRLICTIYCILKTQLTVTKSDSILLICSSLRWRAADILAVCVQNNPYCQKAAMEMNILPTLTSLLETDQLDQVRIKALYAISGEYDDPVRT